MKTFKFLILTTIIIFGFLNNSLAQKCLSENDLIIEISSPCIGKPNGEIHIKFKNKNSGDFSQRSFALYNMESNNFERNRIDTRVKVLKNKIIYPDLNEGLYQIAFYSKDCNNFPTPELFPRNGIELKSEDCK
jgi:hypothetical protein